MFLPHFSIEQKCLLLDFVLVSSPTETISVYKLFSSIFLSSRDELNDMTDDQFRQDFRQFQTCYMQNFVSYCLRRLTGLTAANSLVGCNSRSAKPPKSGDRKNVYIRGFLMVK